MVLDVGGWCDSGGILRVAEIVADYRHAVVRDLVSLGYHGDTPIDFGDFISIVLASPPMTAVRYAATGGWDQTDQLLANVHEQLAGVRELPHQYERPGGVDVVAADPGPVAPGGSPRFTPQTREEFEARRARDRARGEELAATERREVKRHA